MCTALSNGFVTISFFMDVSGILVKNDGVEVWLDPSFMSNGTHGTWPYEGYDENVTGYRNPISS